MIHRDLIESIQSKVGENRLEVVYREAGGAKWDESFIEKSLKGQQV